MTDFEATNARGVVLATFSDFDMARTWVRRNAHIHTGLKVEAVTTERQVIYRPRAASDGHGATVTQLRRTAP